MARSPLAQPETPATPATAYGVPFVDFEVQSDRLFDDARELLAMVFPGWAAADLSLKQPTDGITNKRKCDAAPRARACRALQQRD
ncbi:hypothetical protein H4R21_006071 [Coemansia helicoidea]|uniref:Uncharacterized protein n=1 Tax=Coemansia helicoidea TaxID=1286919 RepID=A0ACC1KQ43_9FUNG|nr:hypothetical protein H4R21_006071 [Coemansia helicoidea]